MDFPNLFLIGTQKGGSSSLFAYLERHPDITPFNRKELNVFCADTEEEARKRLSRLSCQSNNSRYYIDALVNYSRYPRYSSSARNISIICGIEKLRFIYILRNPVDRLISNYFWNAEHFGESRPLELAIQSEEQYIKTSLYDFQIEQYLQYFDINQFYFVCFKDFINSPIQESNRIFEWLELSRKEDLNNLNKKGSTNKEFTRTARFRSSIIYYGHILLYVLSLTEYFPERQLHKWLTF